MADKPGQGRSYEYRIVDLCNVLGVYFKRADELNLLNQTTSQANLPGRSGKPGRPFGVTYTYAGNAPMKGTESEGLPIMHAIGALMLTKSHQMKSGKRKTEKIEVLHGKLWKMKRPSFVILSGAEPEAERIISLRPPKVGKI